MGQYYSPVLFTKFATSKHDWFGNPEFERRCGCLYPHDFGEGLKLMEHAFVNNSLVNEVLLRIKIMGDDGARLVWYGDYAFDQRLYETYRDLAIAAEAVTCSEYLAKRFPPTFDEESYIFPKVYVVNEALREYVVTSITNESRDEISPIPLLTAAGNGRGGGDYEGTNMDLVGSWAFDTLVITEKEPEGGYTCLEPKFEESRGVF